MSKVHPSIKPMCNDCYITRNKRKLVIRCHKTRKHNQRQGN